MDQQNILNHKKQLHKAKQNLSDEGECHDFELQLYVAILQVLYLFLDHENPGEDARLLLTFFQYPGYCPDGRHCALIVLSYIWCSVGVETKVFFQEL